MRKRTAFVTDAMLGKLTRWLRLLGVKVFFVDANDDAVIKKAVKEKAVLLTRDETLASKAENYAKTVLFKTNDSFEQLRLVMKRFSLKAKNIPSFALCPKCGGRIKRIAKAKVEGKVFPRVFRRQKIFWACTECGQVYWKGSHWVKITKKLESFKRKGI